MSFAVVHLDRAGDAVAIGGEGLVTLSDHVHDGVKIALDTGSQRAESIGQAAFVDDIQEPGDVDADAFALVHRPHAEFRQKHDFYPS